MRSFFSALGVPLLLCFAILNQEAAAGGTCSVTGVDSGTCVGCVADLNDDTFYWDVAAEWETTGVPGNAVFCIECFNNPTSIFMRLDNMPGPQRQISGLYWEESGCPDVDVFVSHSTNLDTSNIDATRTDFIPSYVTVSMIEGGCWHADGSIDIWGDVHLVNDPTRTNRWDTRGGTTTLYGSMFINEMISFRNSGQMRIAPTGTLHFGNEADMEIRCDPASEPILVEGTFRIYDFDHETGQCEREIGVHVEYGGLLEVASDAMEFSGVRSANGSTIHITADVGLSLGNITTDLASGHAGNFLVDAGVDFDNAGYAFELLGGAVSLGAGASLSADALDLSGSRVHLAAGASVSSTAPLIGVDTTFVVNADSRVFNGVSGSFSLEFPEDAGILSISGTVIGTVNELRVNPTSLDPVVLVNVTDLASALLIDASSDVVVVGELADECPQWVVSAVQNPAGFTTISLACTEFGTDAGDDDDEGAGQLALTIALTASTGILLALIGFAVLSNRTDREGPVPEVPGLDSKKKKASKPMIRPNQKGGITVEQAVENLLNVYTIPDLVQYTHALLDKGLDEAAVVLAFKMEKEAIGGPAHLYLAVLDVLGRALLSNKAKEAVSDVKKVYRATVSSGEKKVTKSQLKGSGIEGMRKTVNRLSRAPTVPPHQRSPEKRRSNSGNRRGASPDKKRGASPDKKRGASPDKKRGASPDKKRSNSAGRKRGNSGMSANKRGGSPQKRGASPQKRSGSPQKRGGKGVADSELWEVSTVKMTLSKPLSRMSTPISDFMSVSGESLPSLTSLMAPDFDDDE